VDPAGGSDASAPGIVWMSGSDHGAWALLAVRATATGHAVTIFLEYTNERGDAGAWLDAVELLAYPCPLGDAPPCLPPKPQRHCVDWREEQRPRMLGPTYEKSGFSFASLDEAPLRIVVWGEPSGQGKLALPPKALEVKLPIVGSHVIAHVVLATGDAIRMRAFDESHAPVGQAQSSSQTTAPQALVISAPGVASLLFTGGGREGAVIDICVDAAAPHEPDGASDTPPVHEH
jgi:hypothetical protein